MASRFQNLRPGALVLALAISVFIWAVAQGTSSVQQSFEVEVELAGVEENLVVTEQSVVIHRGDRFLLEITPRSTGVYEVARDHDRLSLRAGSGKSIKSWSVRPPEDAAGWAESIRAVIRGTAGAKRRDTRS